MIEISIIIPKADNHQAPFGGEAFEAFEDVLTDVFGGFTSPRGDVVGAWLDNGRVYADTSRLYVVALGSLADGGKIADVVSAAKAIFSQEAIYVRYLGMSEIL